MRVRGQGRGRGRAAVLFRAWGWRAGIVLGLLSGGHRFRVQGLGFRVSGLGFRGVRGRGLGKEGQAGRDDRDRLRLA